MCSKCWREEVNRREQVQQPETEAKVSTTEEESAVESKATAKGISGEQQVSSEPFAEESVSVAETAPCGVSQVAVAAAPAAAAPHTPQAIAGRPESKRSAGEEAPTSEVKTKKKKKKKPRCGVCDKKLGVTAIMCRCEKHFCSVHRYPECHACTFDFRQAERAVLAEHVTGGGQFERVTKI